MVAHVSLRGAAKWHMLTVMLSSYGVGKAVSINVRCRLAVVPPPPRDLPCGTLTCLVIFILASLHCSIGGQYASGTSRNDGKGGGYTVTDVKHDFVGGIISAAGTLVFFFFFLESAFVTRNMYVITKTRARRQSISIGWKWLCNGIYA